MFFCVNSVRIDLNQTGMAAYPCYFLHIYTDMYFQGKYTHWHIFYVVFLQTRPIFGLTHRFHSLFNLCFLTVSVCRGYQKQPANKGVKLRVTLDTLLLKKTQQPI